MATVSFVLSNFVREKRILRNLAMNLWFWFFISALKPARIFPYCACRLGFWIEAQTCVVHKSNKIELFDSDHPTELTCQYVFLAQLLISTDDFMWIFKVHRMSFDVQKKAKSKFRYQKDTVRFGFDCDLLLVRFAFELLFSAYFFCLFVCSWRVSFSKSQSARKKNMFSVLHQQRAKTKKANGY